MHVLKQQGSWHGTLQFHGNEKRASPGGQRNNAMIDGETVFVASVGDWGFFSGGAPQAASLETGSLPHNVRNDLRIVQIEGLEFPVQFFTVSVTSLSDGHRTDHVVISAYPPFPVDAITDVAQRVLPACGSAALCVMVQDRAGWATTYAVTAAPPRAIAAAVAHIKVAGGWDESDPIVIVIDERDLCVSTQFDGESWRLVVRENS